MKKPITLLHIARCSLSRDSIEVESLETLVHLSPTIVGRVHALIGVSTSDIDMVITDDFFEPRDTRDVQVVSICLKTGKYDGSVRVRVLLRRLPTHQTLQLPFYTLSVSYSDDSCEVLLDDYGYAHYRRVFRRFTVELSDAEHVGDILIWHWRHYYTHLQEDDVKDLLPTFAIECAGLTLPQANRLASRYLYRASRDRGMHKLTLREQARLGLEGQWHSDEAFAHAKSQIQGAPTGVGEFTEAAAHDPSVFTAIATNY